MSPNAATLSALQSFSMSFNLLFFWLGKLQIYRFFFIFSHGKLLEVRCTVRSMLISKQQINKDDKTVNIVEHLVAEEPNI